MKAKKLTQEVCEKLVAAYILTSDEKHCIALMSAVCAIEAPGYKARSIRNRYHQLRALDIKTQASRWCYDEGSNNLFQNVAISMLPDRFMIQK